MKRIFKYLAILTLAILAGITLKNRNVGSEGHVEKITFSILSENSEPSSDYQGRVHTIGNAQDHLPLQPHYTIFVEKSEEEATESGWKYNPDKTGHLPFLSPPSVLSEVTAQTRSIRKGRLYYFSRHLHLLFGALLI